MVSEPRAVALSAIAPIYESTLHDYLTGVDEPALAQAYELGRQAMRGGLSILDMATIHREALANVGLGARTSEESERRATRATEFFLESVSAFELVERGFRDANITLRHLNDALEQRKRELETTNRELAKEIAERQQAEERLRHSEERFRTLVESVRDYAIFGLDLEGRVTSWNTGAERLSGYRADEIIGRHVSVFFTPEDVARGQPSEELRAAAAEGRYETETYRVRNDGSRYWADVVITAVRDDDGRLRSYSKVIRDMTARKQAEDDIRQLNRELAQRVQELSALNQELEAFSYSISHDLRAPLRAIESFSRLALGDFGSQLPPNGQHYLQLVLGNAEEMSRLIQALLTLSRTTRQALCKQTVQPGDLVREVLESMQSEQAGRQLQIEIGDLPACQADPILLKQVWTNLISNALKFTRQREIAHIEIGSQFQVSSGRNEPSLVSSAEGSGGKPVIVYFVKDNGAGFDMEHAGERLFGVFQRFHHPQDYEGNGVGLAIVTRIIRRHGGRVWAQAAVDRGATFYFTLGEY